ncbi:MAG TPA: helix-turn-helix domain-containing protein [Rhizobiales bacterium]|nr:helix-turn-helix domain-containing protein [Hyphomicrobiales bacterium]
MDATNDREFKKTRFNLTDYSPKKRLDELYDRLASGHQRVSCDPRGWTRYSARIEECRNSHFEFCNWRAEASVLRRQKHHIHEDNKSNYAFSVLSKGEVFVEHNGVSSILKQGQMVLLDLSRPFTFSFTREVSGTCFRVSRAILDARFPWLESACKGPIDSNNTLSRTFLDYLLYATGKLDVMDREELSRTSGHLLDLASLMMEGRTDAEPTDTGRKAALLAAMKTYISANLTMEGLSSGSIAARFGCTDRYVQIIFKASGTTVSRYIRQQRLSYARQLLRLPLFAKMPIIEIAFRSGFQSSSYFGACFKAKYGITPQEYRNSVRLEQTS